jgi:hypothetical protein
MLWTDASSREFIAGHYPWFLDTFDNYTYPIQRADAIRYFVLHHYGGIYLDLDIGCLRPLDPLLIYPVILPKTIPVGVSNDLMFAEKGHPFLAQTIGNLKLFDHSWILNYPTVMFSTGPMFISAQYGLYSATHASARDAIRILPKSLYGKNANEGEAPHSFFSHFYGSSWHADDAAFIGFLGTWGKVLMWIGLAVFILGLAKLVLPSKQRTYGLRKIGGYDVVLPRWSHRNGRWNLDLGWFTIPAPGSSQTPSPESSSPTSPVDEEHISLLPIPFPASPASSSSDTFPHSESSALHPIFDAVRRARNHAASIIRHREAVGLPRTNVRSRRQRASRGVMFFLPAIFTQSQDIDLSPPRDRPRPFERTVPPITGLPLEKQESSADLERAGELDDSFSDGFEDYPRHPNADYIDFPLHSESRSRSRSASRNS